VRGKGDQHAWGLEHLDDPEMPNDQRTQVTLAQYVALPAIVPSRLLGVASAGKVLYTAGVIHPRHEAYFRAFELVDSRRRTHLAYL
jgi:hypothetical protein